MTLQVKITNEISLQNLASLRVSNIELLWGNIYVCFHFTWFVDTETSTFVVLTITMIMIIMIMIVIMIIMIMIYWFIQRQIVMFSGVVIRCRAHTCIKKCTSLLNETIEENLLTSWKITILDHMELNHWGSSHEGSGRHPRQHGGACFRAAGRFALILRC